MSGYLFWAWEERTAVRPYGIPQDFHATFRQTCDQLLANRAGFQARTSLAFAKILSNISRVNLPVWVFCWLGW